MRRFRSIILVAAMTVSSIVMLGSAAEAGCVGSSTLFETSATCHVQPSTGSWSHVVSDGDDYRVFPVCAVYVGALCGRSLTCTDGAGRPGVLHQLYVNGTPEGRACIGETEADAAGIVTPAQVLRAMQRLDWPESQLVIQPPDGLTLVNFATNFYTPSARPITRSVTLLGQRITIEATPAEYHWHFGDGRSLSTTEPGAPYPDLTVTHDYRRTGTYGPSLATTYSGRYRVGGGPWQAVPGTVTVAGAEQTLRVVEAQPKLVGH